MTNYTYAAAYVRSLENGMLNQSGLRELAQCRDAQSVMQLLEKKGFSGDNLTEMLENEQKKVWDTCIELCGDDEPMKALLAENDYYNIKAVIKAALSGKNAEEFMLYPSDIDADEIYSSVKTGDFSALDEKTSKICSNAVRIYAESGSAQRLETYIDRCSGEDFLEKSKCSDFLHGYAELTVLIKNLRIFLRGDKRISEEALIPCAGIDIDALKNASSKRDALEAQGLGAAYDIFDKSPGEFELFCENMIADYIEKAKTDFFDFGAVLDYFVGKQTEIRNIRIIASGITFGDGAADISERLVRGYV